MVRARSLGRKWGLRACGRALFADVAARYKAGIMNFEYLGPAQNWDECCSLGRHVAESSQKQFRVAQRMKAQLNTETQYSTFSHLNLDCFFYVSLLAESRGFLAVFGILERVWKRAFQGVLGDQPGWQVEGLLHTLRVVNNPGFSFRPNRSFRIRSATECVPGDTTLSQQLGGTGFRKLADGVGLHLRAFGGIEVMSTMYFVLFIHYLFHPTWQNLRDIPIVTVCEHFQLTIHLDLD